MREKGGVVLDRYTEAGGAERSEPVLMKPLAAAALVGMSKSTLYRLLPELHEKGVAVKIADHAYMINRRRFLRFVGEDVA